MKEKLLHMEHLIWFHIGHLNLLRRAKQFGDYLIVAVSTDAFNDKKGKKCAYPFEHRIEIVKSICFVDEVICEKCWEQKETDIKKYNIDTFVIGDDWRSKFDNLSTICNVEYISRTDGISTTFLKENINQALYLISINMY